MMYLGTRHFFERVVTMSAIPSASGTKLDALRIDYEHLDQPRGQDIRIPSRQGRHQRNFDRAGDTP